MNPSENTEPTAENFETTESSLNIAPNIGQASPTTYTDREYQILLDNLSTVQISKAKREEFDPTYFKPFFDGPLTTKGLRNSHVLDKILEYRRDDKLSHFEILGIFQSDFEGWTVHDFDNVSQHVRQALRNSLRYRGVYTGQFVGGRISTQLAHLLTLTDLLPWDMKDLHYRFDSFYYFFQNLCRQDGLAPDQLRESPTTQIDPSATSRKGPINTPMPPHSTVLRDLSSTPSNKDEHKEITAQQHNNAKEAHEESSELTCQYKTVINIVTYDFTFDMNGLVLN